MTQEQTSEAGREIKLKQYQNWAHLVELCEKTGTNRLFPMITDDVLAVDAELTRLRGEVEQLTAERGQIEHTIAQECEMAGVSGELDAGGSVLELVARIREKVEQLSEKYSILCPVCRGEGSYARQLSDTEIEQAQCQRCDCTGRVMMRGAEEVKVRVDVCKRAKSPDAYRETANVLSWVLKGG